MKEKQSKKNPGQSIVYMVICAVIILAFILFGLYPRWKVSGQQYMEITKYQAQIEEQKLLHPLYQKLSEKLQAIDSKILPSPSKSKLPKDKTDKTSSIFGEIAQKSELEAVSITPDVKSIISGSGPLLINTVLKGDFFDFQKFLIELGGIPYLEYIEQIQIQALPGSREFRLKIWLALSEVSEKNNLSNNDS